LSVDDVVSDGDRKRNRYHFDRHSAEYRSQFKDITEEMHAQCPMAWSDTYGGHWVAAGSHEVFELARCPAVSNDHDVNNVRRGYKGISIPTASRINGIRGGILEMDNPEHKTYRGVLNPYLSPAAVKRWEPFIDDVTRACLDEKIEEGRIDFVDLQGVRNYSGQRAYSQSKLASVMFTYELARRLEGTGVTATVLHPGVVRTSFGAEDQAAYFAVMIRVARLFMKTPAQGAVTPIYLASSPEVEGITGRYFVNRKPKTSSNASYDTTAAARLWQASIDLAGMTATA